MKLQIIPTIQSGVTSAATWDTVKYWAELAAKFSHASVAAQVMAGFALNELKKANNIKPGNPHRGQLPNDLVIKTWPELVAEFAGISDETARNWMRMADGVKAKWKKLAPQEKLKALMSVSPSQWSEDDTKLVTASLHKIADGQTQTDFMRELGLAKKPSKNPNAGDYEHGKKKALTTAEAAAEIERMALEDSVKMGEWIRASNRSFVNVSDLEVSVQCSLLEEALKVRNKWLATPKAKRDAAQIDAMLKTL